MARVLVTGGAGRAGRQVVAALLERGHQVRASFRRAPGAAAGVDWRRADLTDIAAIEPLIEGCEAVLHLAAELTDMTAMQEINVAATRNLLATAARRGVRYFGHASSIVVYGSPRTRTVSEATPRLDPERDMGRQYYAEPYMLEYARTKTAGELAIEALQPRLPVDLYRPGVVVEDSDLLAAGDWSRARKVFAAYRRTQFITAGDAAAAMVHLLERGLSDPARRSPVEAYNLVEEPGLTYRDLLGRAWAETGEARFRVGVELPMAADLAKDVARHRHPQLRFPLGMLNFSAAKLRATGFAFPIGIHRALDRVLKARRAPGV